MPSVQDQLSKLIGMTFICIFMGFLPPSLGVRTNSECISNMLALSIFVITVLVNICIQMHTGLIKLFLTEHIIILCCMMLLLSVLWADTINLNIEKQNSTDYIKDCFNRGQGSLLLRLKKCFIYGYESNLQLRQCRRDSCPVTCALCIICVVVLLQVIFRSFVSKEFKLFDRDFSDYEWSLWAIVSSQIVAVLVGCLGTIIRFLSMVNHLQTLIVLHGDISSLRDACIGIVAFPFASILYLIICFCCVASVSTDIVTELVKNFDWVSRESNHVTKEEMIEEEYLHKGLKCREGVVLDEWTLRKSGEDMKRLIAKSVAKVPNHLIKLLHQTPPSTQEYSLATLLKTHEHYHTDISSLSMVVLAGFATLSMPSSRSQCILGSLDEVFEILFYIDQRLPTTSLFERKTSCANKVWRFKEFFGTLFEKTKSEVVASQLQIDQVIEDLESVAGKLTSLENYPIAHEVEVISCFIRHEAYTSMDELHKGMEQLFVDMLSEHLVQLPGIIFKDIIGSSLEDMEKKLRDALKVVSRIDKKLEGVLQWSFPVGSTITSLVTEAATSMDGEDNGNTIAIDVNSNEIPVTENHSSVSFEDASGKKNYTLRFTTGEGDISSIVSAAAQDEVIEIE